VTSCASSCPLAWRSARPGLHLRFRHLCDSCVREDFDETLHGLRYRRIHTAVTTWTPPTYHIANAKAATRHSRAALVDCGANGGLAGFDCRIISLSANRFVNVEGIDG
jgi:hypothetical protein